MTATVGIIGTGWVGASTAISLLQSGIAGTLLLNDIDDDVAEGEAMDLAHGAAFLPPATVLTAAVEDMLDADVVVVSAGRGGRPGETRLDLLQTTLQSSEKSAASLSATRVSSLSSQIRSTF